MSLFDNVQRFQTLGITTETINNGKFQREIYEAMRRFKSLEWGDVSGTDTESNNEAVKTFSMVLGHIIPQRAKSGLLLKVVPAMNMTG